MRARLRRFLQKRVFPRRYPRFGAQELRAGLARVGITPGVNVFVHSAWDEFYNFDGQPLDLIRVLQD